MNKFYIKIISTVFVTIFTLFISANLTLAASTPSLSLTNGASAVNISVTNADPNATVNFYFPSSNTNNSNSITYTSIDIGQTNSSGSFNISVAPNSYGLNGGTSVYISVDNVNSPSIIWPAAVNSSIQNGSLILSQQNTTMTVGQTVNIFPTNTSNTLTVQGNTNSSVASAYFQSSNNSVIITGQNTGSTTVSICAGTAGCSSVSVSVQAPTQTITFSQSPAYIILGNSAQNINIYGPGSGYSVSNPNQNILTTSLNGTSVSLQGLSLGQVTLSVCASGWICGSLPVNIVSSGTAVPNQVNNVAPINSNFSQAPQLTSFSLTSNDVMNQFLGTNSTLTLTFAVNQTVNNVQVKIAGQQVSVGQGNSGTYSASYMVTGNETLPLPVVISYTNPNGLVGQNYFWIGDSAKLPVNSNVSGVVSGGASSVGTGSGTVTGGTFTKLLSLNSTGSEVKALQQRLKDDGIYSGPITGKFGPLTEAAVKKYQAKNGLSQAGVVGPATRVLLNKGN